MNRGIIAVLTSRSSWFIPYARKFVSRLKKSGYQARLFTSHENIPEKYNIVFMLSYFRIIEKSYLDKREHNIVVHESDLPEGKGWAPLFWQILKGQNVIPVVLFEASQKIDAGDIYIKSRIGLRGNELHDEIRSKQAAKSMELCMKFLSDMDKLKPLRQRGRSTVFRRRSPSDSILNINKSIKEQFNQLRISDNKNYPAFFRYKNSEYVLKIYKKDNKGRIMG
ncbi:formyltransferase family protein [Elusimicrobiota bacterium]